VDEIEPSPAPADLARLMAEDRMRWQRVVARANLRIE
jgi:hypothetical protein